jgi:hypothetical protein
MVWLLGCSYTNFSWEWALSRLLLLDDFVFVRGSAGIWVSRAPRTNVTNFAGREHFVVCKIDHT